MVERATDALNVTVTVQQLHGVHFARRMRRDVGRKAISARSALDVRPNSLARPMAHRVAPMGEHPLGAGMSEQIDEQLIGQIDSTPLPCFGFHDIKLPAQLRRTERQDVTNTEASM